MKDTIRAAFSVTVPVLFGYVFTGIAFGIFLCGSRFSVWWALLMSVFVYAGSMQFVAVSLLTGPFSLLTAAAMTLTVNARHLFYGLSMVEPFRGFGGEKPFMIFSLTDETYSLLCAAKAPEGVRRRDFLFCISLLDYLYWVTGSVVGGLIGSSLPFSAKGIDFVMTSLFTVIFLDQWKEAKSHVPALAGVCGALLCLLLFGAQRFIIPSMLLILLALLLLRRPLERRGAA